MHHNSTAAAPERQSFEDLSGTSGLVRYVEAVSRQRTIPVGDAQTIVVRPRIPGWFKGLLGLSLGLNVLVLVLLLVVGTRGYRWYRALSSELAPLTTGQLVPKGAVSPDRDPAAVVGGALDTARHSVGEALGAVQEIEAATIHAVIPVDQQLPLQLQVPISQDTVVVTNAPVPIEVPALITLPGGGGYVNGTVAMELPAGMQLPVHMGLTVPLSTTVPVKFDLPVNIPLRDTELAGPFARLRRLLEPAAERLGAE